MTPPTFSVILPFYKQSDHMDRVIREYVDGLNAANLSYEIIIAVNGETSAAEEESMSVVSEEPRIVRIVLRKAGWGLAIRKGFAVARGEYVAYTNTARTFVDEFLKVLRYARVSRDVVVKGARLIRENKTRKVISYFYNLENRLLLHTPVLDVNATPKVIPRALLEGMAFITEDEFFCAEFMYRCYQRNIPIIEIPIRWAQRKGGRSTTNIKTALKLSLGLPILRLRVHRGPTNGSNDLVMTGIREWVQGTARAAARGLRRQWIPLAIAIVVGVICVAPHVAARFALGDGYRGVPYFFSEDDDYYLTRMQEIVDGHWAAGSPYLYEYKDQPNAQASVADAVFYAIPSIVTRVPLKDFSVFTKFLYPAALFLLAYALAKRLAADAAPAAARWAAVAAGSLVTLGYQFFDARSLIDAFRGAASGVSLSVWVRPVNPITGGLLLFGALNVLFSMFRRPRIWKAFVLGAIWALMIGYVFSWALMLAVLAVSFVRMAAVRRWIDVRAIGVALAVGLLADAPFFLTMFFGSQGFSGGFAERNGLTYTHIPTLNKYLITATLGFAACSIILAVRNREKRSWRDIPEWWWFSATLLLAGHLAYAQQIVTGRTIYPYHFVQYTKPFAIIAAVLATAAVLRSRPKLFRWIAAAAIAASVVNGVGMALTYRGNLDLFLARQSDAPMYDWLNANAPRDCVVLVQEASERRAPFIPALTSCNIYLKTYITMRIPPERIRQNVFVWMRMNGVTPETSRAWVEAHENAIRGWFFDSWTTLRGQGKDEWFLEVEDDVASGYAEFYSENFADRLRDYRIDYLLTDHELNADEERLFGAGTPVFSENGLTLYVMPPHGAAVAPSLDRPADF